MQTNPFDDYTRNGRPGEGRTRLDGGAGGGRRRRYDVTAKPLRAHTLYSFNYIVVMGLDESVNYSRAVYVLIGSNGSDEKV